MQVQGIVTANSRYIELRYETPKGWATPHFHPSEEEELEKKLLSLKCRHIEATVSNLLTGEVVGSVEEGEFDNRSGIWIGRWIWWYWPAGVDAKEQPSQMRTIVSSLANDQDSRAAHIKSAETRVSAKVKGREP